MRYRHWVGFTALVVVGFGCGSPTIQEFLPGELILYGTVNNAVGTPIQGAKVAIRQCNSPSSESEAALTDASGKYRKQVVVVGSIGDCVRLSVTALGFAPDSATVTGFSFGLPPDVDSVATAIVLSPE